MSRISAAMSIAARSLTVVTALAVAGGGIAIAAATGLLPTAAHSPQSGSSHPGRNSSASESNEPSEPAESDASGARPSDVPSPSLDGLCHAFQAGATDNPGKALDSPAFRVLVAAAGGVANVAGFCDDRIGAGPSLPPGASNAVTPSHPTGPPEGVPSHSHPTAAPSHPTGRP